MDEKAATVRFLAFGGLQASDIAALKDLANPLRHLRKGEILRHEGEPDPKMYFLIEGWTASSIDVPNGSRLLIKVHMPGDMIGMPGLAMANAPDTITALTPTTVSMIDTPTLGRLFKINPRIAALLFLISQEERVALMDRLVSIGRTNAVSRVAAVVTRLHRKIVRTFPATTECFEIPLTQSDLADMTGLTVVHVNRTIQRLRQDKILTWTNQNVTILDFDGLERLAGLPVRNLRSRPMWAGLE
jgi:CRP/FNR family transcriptional regulator